MKNIMTWLSVLLIMVICFLQIMEPWAWVIIFLCLGWIWIGAGEEECKP